jgi:hypothetical protein
MKPPDLSCETLSPSELTTIVTAFARGSSDWIERVRFRAGRRWFERVYHGPLPDIWIISWLPGQSTGFHDHGDSAGSFIVATGALEEIRPGGPSQTVGAGQSRSFGQDYAHDVRNLTLAPAISIHAYSPPLDEMNEYELDGGQLVPRTIPRGTTQLCISATRSLCQRREAVSIAPRGQATTSSCFPIWASRTLAPTRPAIRPRSMHM